jgi:hypothetical protein
MICAWLVLTALAVASLGVLLSSGITSNMEFRGSKPASLIGQNLVEKRLTGPQKMTDFVIVRSATLKTSDPIFQGYVESLSARTADLGPGVVQSVSSVYTTHDRTLVSKDGRRRGERRLRFHAGPDRRRQLEPDDHPGRQERHGEG